MTTLIKEPCICISVLIITFYIVTFKNEGLKALGELVLGRNICQQSLLTTLT